MDKRILTDPAGVGAPGADCVVEAFGDVGLAVCIGRHRHRAGLAEVYRRHGGAILDLAARVGGAAIGADVLQRVVVDLWERPSRFDPDGGSLRDHLLSDAHALAVEAVRAAPRARRGAVARLGRRRRPHVADLAALAERVGSHAWPLLSELADDERNVIALTYFCGYRCSELAGPLAQAPITVNRRARAGLEGLARRR